jgi:hypothetical protein
MLRTRLVLLAIVAALLAPAVAPCLLSTTGGQAAMPCCHKQAPATPSVRECCAPAEGTPAMPAATAQTARIAPAPVSAFVAPAPFALLHLRADVSPHIFSVQPHRLFTVLLI